MTTHELARQLLGTPDQEVVIVIGKNILEQMDPEDLDCEGWVLGELVRIQQEMAPDGRVHIVAQ